MLFLIEVIIIKLVDELFLKYELIDYNLLINYGFIIKDGYYYFYKNINNNEFRLEIIYDKFINAKLIDLSFNDEYDQFNVDNKGEFLDNLKKEVTNILINIRDKCFKSNYFSDKKANLITDYIIKKYDSIPEFLWEKYPDFGVFRHKNNNKWFSLIMEIKKDKLIKKASGNVFVMNLKLDNEIENYINNNGVYKSYHMNKKYWVSIILDDIDDNLLYKLIDISYNITLK